MKVWLMLCAVFAAADGQAATADFAVYGQLVQSPCALAVEDSQIEVDMKSWTQETFAINQRGPAIPFVIHLTDCYPEVAQQVGVSFTGEADARNPALLALASSSTASGVGIELSDSHGVAIAINRDVYSQRLVSGANDVPLQAQLVTVSDTVTPGSFSATVDFELSYP